MIYIYFFYFIYLIIFSFFVFNFNKRKNIKLDQPLLKLNKKIERNRFSVNKIPNNIDTIVIGSGISGLTTAALLSRAGQKVLVLEQHYIAGGAMHTFEENGIEHETGIHYVGNVEKRKEILDYITDKEIEWCKMGKNNNFIYDEICIGNNIYKFRAGKQNFIKDMIQYFPNEKNNILEYINLIEDANKDDTFFKLKMINNYFLKKIMEYKLSSKYKKYVETSAYDIISSITDNEELKAVLCGQCGDYGMSPKKVNFYIHAAIVNHYFEGGYYPLGGPSEITKSIIPIIEKNGGKVLVGKSVRQILIEYDVEYGIQSNNPITTGVQMENGIKIYSKNVVSSVGVYNTFFNLTNEFESKYIFNPYKEFINKIGQSIGFIYLFVNLNGSPEDLELKSSNLWIYPNNNLDECINNFRENIFDNPMPMFISSSCAKDKSWNNRYSNKSNATVLAMINKDWFEEWKNEKCTNRNEVYKQIKDKLAEKMLNEGLYKFYPKTKGKVSHFSVGTPLSNNFYFGVSNGEAYGLGLNSDRFLDSEILKPKTCVKNLYLSGQDICTLGFTGGLLSGVMTAHSILGYGNLKDIIFGNNIINDYKN